MFTWRRLGIPIVFIVATFPVAASEADALAISAKIQARFLPFGTIMEPIYASSSSSQVVNYTDCGDSALWTGAYLAAEAFRYKVTQSADALNNVQGALAGLKALTDVTGTIAWRAAWRWRTRPTRRRSRVRKRPTRLTKIRPGSGGQYFAR